jgi:hypothetical protein
MRRGAHASLATVLQSDFVMVQRFVRGAGDFNEGVTAKLIDRGRKPVWRYNSVEEVGGGVRAGCWDMLTAVTEPVVLTRQYTCTCFNSYQRSDAHVLLLSGAKLCGGGIF